MNDLVRYRQPKNIFVYISAHVVLREECLLIRWAGAVL